MPTWICPHCDARMTIKPVHIGNVNPCLSCGVPSEVIATESLAEMLENADAVTTRAKRQVKKEYKVLTQADSWLNNRFDPKVLERALNTYAHEGWSLKAAVGVSIPALLGQTRDEIVIILER